MKGNKGVSDLALVLVHEMERRSSGPAAIDLGSILSHGSLQLDQFRISISPSDFLVANWQVDLSASAGIQQDVDIRFHPQPGDRVLVVWAEDDPVILCRVVTGNA